jgi:hypothetical protein
MMFFLAACSNMTATDPCVWLGKKRRFNSIKVGNNKNNMKNSYKAALLAALGLISAVSAQAANNDLILGITTGSGSAGVNDLVVDLGQLSSFTAGESFNLGYTTAQLTAATTSGGLGGSIAAWSAGIIGGQNGQTSGGHANVGNDVFTTTLDTGTPSNTAVGTPAYNNGASSLVNISVANIGGAGGVAAGFAGNGTQGIVSAGASTSFSGNIAVDPNTAGTLNPNFTGKVGLTDNPLATIGSSDIITMDLWQDTVIGTGTTSTGMKYDGFFTLNLSGATPTLTYDEVSAVPEPSTYGMIAGAGLLLVSFRNKLVRKNA